MANFAYFHALGGLVARKIADAPRSQASEEDDPRSSFTDRWFFDSSFELKHGLIVREVAPDAIPKDAFERLFPPLALRRTRPLGQVAFATGAK